MKPTESSITDTFSTCIGYGRPSRRIFKSDQLHLFVNKNDTQNHRVFLNEFEDIPYVF